MVTVFTSIYNRAYVIENLYQSLLRQTCSDFEWLVVDDGSDDNISELLYKWIERGKAKFKIRFYQQENGGKHRAINRGIQLAKGDAFFIVDSDDYLTNNAIELINKWWNDIERDEHYAGISGLKAKKNGEVVGGRPSYQFYVDATNLERKKYGLLGDKAEVYKTSVLKEYLFPEFEGENFLTEAIVWNKIARDGYKIRWHNKITYICEYRDDGLSRCGYKKSINNPRGYMEYLKLMSEIYGRSYGEAYKFGFYFVLRPNNSIKRCMEKMDITLQEVNELEKKYERMILEMNQYFQKNNIKSVALYGFGNVGNAFLEVSKKLNIIIKYAIDIRHIKNGKIRVYLPEEKMPKVDAVIITLKDYNKKAEMILRTTFSTIVYWKNISLKYWVN